MHKPDYTKELMDSIPKFNKDITELILSYKIFDPIHTVVFNCHLCDFIYKKYLTFNPSLPMHWDLPCHPSHWGSHQVDAIHTIEHDDYVSTTSYQGRSYYSSEEED